VLGEKTEEGLDLGEWRIHCEELEEEIKNLKVDLLKLSNHKKGIQTVTSEQWVNRLLNDFGNTIDLQAIMLIGAKTYVWMDDIVKQEQQKHVFE
jgi:hypothetical protein